MTDHANPRIVVRATPQHCFETVLDGERLPEWAPDIKEAVVLVRDDEGRPAAVERGGRTLSDLLGDEKRRAEMGREARRRAEAEFSYDVLARRLRAGIDGATLVG